MSFGCDFSWSRPSIASLKSAGVTFVCRYLNDPGGKGLTKAEYQSYINAGFAVVIIYEESGQELLGGYAAGQRVARNAKAALAALGLGVRPVYFTVDFDANASQIATVRSALDGAASILGFGNVGIYGSDSVIDACVGSHCRYGFQTYAWSGGRLSGRAHLYQYSNGRTIGGGSVDYCRNIAADFGATKTLPGSGVVIGYNASSYPTTAVQKLVGATPDGDYGPDTTAKVAAWQKAHGLTPDGIVGPLTAAAMFAPKPPAPAAPAAPTMEEIIMTGFIHTPNGDVYAINADTGKKRLVLRYEWPGYLANGAKFAEVTQENADTIPNA